MSATISRFEVRIAPCERPYGGERRLSDDLQGLITEELHYSCGCRVTKEEFHDGSVHRMVIEHGGKVLVDEELRGE